jgi:tRNA A37 threonylcarbamoyltransferase TsaD
MTYKIKETLVRKKTKFQDLSIVDTYAFGRMLILDGIVQTSINDEYVYHEMITHIPLNTHPNPKKVLVVGGVAANLFIRNRIQNKTAENGIRVYFAKPQFSSDNATGVAYIGTYDQHCG